MRTERAWSSWPKASGERWKVSQCLQAPGDVENQERPGFPPVLKMSVCLCEPLTCVVLFSLCFLSHEIININLRNKPDWYYTKHPFGQIPVLENSRCQLIYESVIACEYLDDAYPGRKLYPYDPYERARQKMLLELFYKVCGFFFF